MIRNRLKNICVYCGSSSGNIDDYDDSAKALAAELVSRKLGLVYGGSSTGIMGVLADSVLAAGGQVRGIMPRALVHKEIAHGGLTELRVTGSMHERKALMADMSDGFIALPGGFGTLEEIVEILTWAQLQLHEKPCGLLNVASYYDHFLDFVGHAEEKGFLDTRHREMLLVANDPSELLDRFESYRAPKVEKWS
jgi:uncharacterized protein (TIGR00730 family)